MGPVFPRPDRTDGMKTLAVILLSFAAAFGAKAEASFVVPLSYDATWNRLVQTLASAPSQIQTMDKSSGIILLAPRLVASGPFAIMAGLKGYAIPPKGVLQSYDVATQTLNFFVAKLSPNRTTVRIAAHYQTMSHQIIGGNVINWQSTGKAEQA